MRIALAIKKGPVSPETIRKVEEKIEERDIAFLQDEIPVAIEQSLEGVERVATIVKAMKTFSHPGTTEKTVTDLHALIESTVTVSRNEWKYVAEVETHFDPDLPQVPCYPGDFNQVILNLIVNAAHAIADALEDRPEGEKGRIVISTHALDDEVEIRVSDTGTGIPADVQSRIFEPFFTTKGVGKGTGQGLAIARSTIVEKHHGSLSFETEPGKGTTFIIRLPVRDVDAGDDGSPAGADGAAAEGGGTVGPAAAPTGAATTEEAKE